MIIPIQGAELRIKYDDDSYATVPNCQNLTISYQNNRNTINYIGNCLPERDRQIINYSPIQLNFNYFNNQGKETEFGLGLMNESGICINLIEKNSEELYAVRDFDLMMRPSNSDSYAGRIGLISGVINQYTLNMAVGQPMSSSISIECLDIENYADNNPQGYIPNYGLVPTNKMGIGGINFYGLGLVDFQIQECAISLNINRNHTMRLGQKFPERNISNCSATVTIKGFISNLSDIQKLSEINTNTTSDEVFTIQITKECDNSGILFIDIRNPFLESKSISNQVGNFANVSLVFSVSVPINVDELDYSNLIFY